MVSIVAVWNGFDILLNSRETRALVAAATSSQNLYAYFLRLVTIPTIRKWLKDLADAIFRDIKNIERKNRGRGVKLKFRWEGIPPKLKYKGCESR